MDASWLRARRDALVDRTLAYAIPPAVVLAVLLVTALPSAALAALGGFGAGLLAADVKKNAGNR